MLETAESEFSIAVFALRLQFCISHPAPAPSFAANCATTAADTDVRPKMAPGERSQMAVDTAALPPPADADGPAAPPALGSSGQWKFCWQPSTLMGTAAAGVSPSLTAADRISCHCSPQISSISGIASRSINFLSRSIFVFARLEKVYGTIETLCQYGTVTYDPEVP